MQQINRRVLGEDGKGVGEALNETDHVIGRHLLILETPSKSSSIHRLMAQQFFLSPVVMFSRADDVIKVASSFFLSFFHTLRHRDRVL